jgi:hypothetical protein
MNHAAMIAALLSTGVGAGILSGLFGIGGGILIVPVLVAFFRMDVLHASAISLAALLLPVGILGIFGYHKARLIQWRAAALIAPGLLAGSGLGAMIAVHAPERVLERSYAAFLLYNAINYLGLFALLRRGPIAEEKPREQGAAFALLLVGFGAGIVAGLFGKGGGIVIVPLLMGLYHFKPKEATGTSLAALQLPVGLPGVLVYAHDGVLKLSYATWIVGGLVVGTFFGTKIAIGLEPAAFKKIYGFFLLGVAVYIALR